MKESRYMAFMEEQYKHFVSGSRPIMEFMPNTYNEICKN